MKLTTEDIKRIVDENSDYAVRFLQEMIQIPSVTDHEHEISRWMEKWLGDNLGLPVKAYEAETGRKNLVVDWHGEKEGKRFLFNGHLDVFPPNDDDPGLYGPWSGKVVDGYLYGRGAADMKGGLAATIMAVDLLKKSGYVPATGTVTLSCDIDEENGGEKGIEYMLRQGECKADYGVCAEPTHGQVMVAGGCILQCEITYHAPSFHTSFPRDFDDALQKTHKAMTALYEYADRCNKERYCRPLGNGPTLCISLINGGEVINNIPTSCTISIDRRLVPDESIRQVEGEIIDILEKLKAADPDMDYEYKRLYYCPQYNMDVNHPIVKTALDSYTKVTGKTNGTLVRHGGSDVHKVVEMYPDCCIPNYGPGNEPECCMPNEKISVQDYLDFIKVYMQMVVDMQG